MIAIHTTRVIVMDIVMVVVIHIMFLHTIIGVFLTIVIAGGTHMAIHIIMTITGTTIITIITHPIIIVTGIITGTIIQGIGEATIMAITATTTTVRIPLTTTMIIAIVGTIITGLHLPGAIRFITGDLLQGLARTPMAGHL